METYVQLDREFSTVSRSQENGQHTNRDYLLGSSKPQKWNDILKEFRCVILAEAGAGKTEELKQQALNLTVNGSHSFFIRIEDIDSDFEEAFEVGSQEQFQEWLNTSDEAWFFLDSVDEARLISPNAFKRAINKFTARIANAKHRAHIYISSRPYAWRPSEDRRLLESKLFLPKKSHEDRQGNSERDTELYSDESSLLVMTLRPLDSDKIKRYCVTRGVKDVDHLIKEINRLSLWSLAERPFDLETIIEKWKEDSSLGSRIDLLRHNIKVKLTEQHSADRADTQSLTLKKALYGARRLAASTILTGEAGILIPGSKPKLNSINASEVLDDWSSSDIRSLLELGIFNDIIYETVRFRHREIRDLLTAEWFYSLLKSGADREAITALFFRKQYGENIITPSLRSVLSWLILFDNNLYLRATNISSEIALEGGDPAILPLPVREELLEDIVIKIASNEDNHAARDNTAIARIASQDLTPKTIILINRFIDNDDAIFFLGRLVWQGKMIGCLQPFESIVLDTQRNLYTRIASLRAIVTLREKSDSSEIWSKLNVLESELDEQLIVEFLEELPPSLINAKLLLESLEKINSEKNAIESYRLRQALKEFIDSLSYEDDFSVFNCLLDGLVEFLNYKPFINERYCLISKRYAWLIGNTTQLLEKLIESKSELALSPTALSILISIAHAKNWGTREYDDYKDILSTLIPNWPELNDALYWATIKQKRESLRNEGQRLVDDWQACCHGCFWLFDESSYKRLLGNLSSITVKDDQLVALSTVIRFYLQTGKPKSVLDDLKTAVDNNPALTEKLQTALGPRVITKSDSEKRLDASRRQQEAKELLNKQQRLEWIDSLRENPTRVNDLSRVKPGEITNDLWWLFSEIGGEDLNQGRARGSNWQKLIPEFSEAVAKEYSKAVQCVWRQFNVELQSEHEQYINTYTGALLVAMAGLEIESKESKSFPHDLSTSELKQALRFLAKELNGFPNWLESLFRVYPTETTEAVKTELIWELEHTSAENQPHYILHDILYYAPWVHNAIAPGLFKWLIDNPEKIQTFPEYSIQIMLSSNLSQENLVALANRELKKLQPPEDQAKWLALWLDCEASEAIPYVKQWLRQLSESKAKTSAENLFTYLIGNRRGSGEFNGRKTYVVPSYLKELYLIAYHFIKPEDDIDRTTGGAYTPGLRDNAQSARNHLFSLLCDLPGKQAYIAIKELELEHPSESYRPSMARYALKRAESDGDMEAWDSVQVAQFEHQQLITPKTHRQLHELGVLRLNNMKAWLERGNDSPWETWQKAVKENEIRNLVAGWLNQNCQELYTTAQEPELANAQRMDIWLNSNNVNSPVPIEIKLLDKGWSGNKLCERLRNQLVGDYLRESEASCGIMLLIAAKTNKQWKVDNRHVSLNQLREALTSYWISISKDYPHVNAIEVIVIDLNLRGKVSVT